MNKNIAYCGLDCYKCPAYIATKNNDQKMKEEVAKEWSKLNEVEITPEMINCDGCRFDGAKTPYCASMCEIKLCAEKKKIETCGSCKKLHDCKKIKMITDTNKDALKNLEK